MKLNQISSIHKVIADDLVRTYKYEVKSGESVIGNFELITYTDNAHDKLYNVELSEIISSRQIHADKIRIIALEKQVEMYKNSISF